MRDLENRLAALERAHRLQGRLVVSLGACLVALVTMGAGGSASDVVQARVTATRSAWTDDHRRIRVRRKFKQRSPNW